MEAVRMKTGGYSGPDCTVALVQMPFGSHCYPSIGLGLLKAILTRQDIPARVLYFNLEMVSRLGEATYRFLAHPQRPTDLAGDWVFAEALFGPQSEGEEAAYLNGILRNRSLIPDVPPEDFDSVSEELVGQVQAARKRVEPFLDHCVEILRRIRPRIVGFASMFQQHVAVLALAQRLKRILPETVIVLGGANCEGVMGVETARQFPFIDAVVLGEGDRVLPALVRRVLAGRDLHGMAGVVTPVAATGVESRRLNRLAPVVRNLDRLPIPDYDDFFSAQACCPTSLPEPHLLFESSRGCWWGQHRPCLFCGIPAERMPYRSKSPPRALAEIDHLAARYPVRRLAATDTILDPRYRRQLLPKLAQRTRRLEVVYEIRPTTDKPTLRQLADAGVRYLQAGVESLSDQVLELMNKGVDALHNIQFLKNCKELGLQLQWNLLWGLPGEDPAEYAKMAALLPLLTHLPPPTAAGRIHLHRFSALFQQPEAHGLGGIRPLPAYRHVYPFSEERLRNLAYSFLFDYADGRVLAEYIRPLWQQIRAWWRAAETSDLFMIDKPGRLIVWDLRPVAARPLTVLDGIPRRLLLACDRIRTGAELHHLAEEGRWGMEADGGMARQMEQLLAEGLMLEDRDRFLALPVAMGEYAVPASVWERFWQIAPGLGNWTENGELEIPCGDRPAS